MVSCWRMTEFRAAQHIHDVRTGCRRLAMRFSTETGTNKATNTPAHITALNPPIEPPQ
jgi:hypothetical protein